MMRYADCFFFADDDASTPLGEECLWCAQMILPGERGISAQPHAEEQCLLVYHEECWHARWSGQGAREHGSGECRRQARLLWAAHVAGGSALAPLLASERRELLRPQG